MGLEGSLLLLTTSEEFDFSCIVIWWRSKHGYNLPEKSYSSAVITKLHQVLVAFQSNLLDWRQGLINPLAVFQRIGSFSLIRIN